jgi:hypothetical protein
MTKTYVTGKRPPEGVWRGDRKECPFCVELLGPGKLHICPSACCYVVGFEGEEEVICPYDGQAFQRAQGHICLELIRRTEPAQ